MQCIGNDLYDRPEIARFYNNSNRQRPDFAFCRDLARDANSVLDLGCGTGTFATSLPISKAVTGVDPAAAMLAIAEKQVGGDAVRWVEADARDVQLGVAFDLIVLTGHSFQVFLDESDQMAVLRNIARHLSEDGRFIFDTRNPYAPGRKTRTRAETMTRRVFDGLGEVECWNTSSYDDTSGILTYENGYKILATSETQTAEAQIRYTPQQVLAEMITEAGLAVETWYGDWSGGAFAANSPEIIPFGGLAT